jgi:hypothetical protein
MFAAAKIGNGLCVVLRVNVHWDLILKIIQKKIKKHCGNKKRVLYLHPLKGESL